MLKLMICTVGTSMFFPNMENLKKGLDVNAANNDKDLSGMYLSLAEPYNQSDWNALGTALRQIDGKDRICGAEINSLYGLSEKEIINSETKLFFLHSDTDNGRNIATTLCSYYGERAKAVQIDGLQDEKPKLFRTTGLRNLAKQMCKIILDNKYQKCGINATGGYKAQVAIATIIGQAINVPVYYKHERFNEVIEFPPMPIALDYELWMRTTGMLYDLSRTADMVKAADYKEILEGDDRVESFIERSKIDGVDYIELSPVGLIFQETFKDRFQTERDSVLPADVPEEQKKKPQWEDSGNMKSHPEIREFMEKITNELRFVKKCYTWKYNGDLSSRTHFHLSAKGVEGIKSNGTYTVKFIVETSAITDGQKNAAVAALNAWLEDQR